MSDCRTGLAEVVCEPLAVVFCLLLWCCQVLQFGCRPIVTVTVKSTCTASVVWSGVGFGCSCYQQRTTKASGMTAEATQSLVTSASTSGNTPQTSCDSNTQPVITCAAAAAAAAILYRSLVTSLSGCKCCGGTVMTTGPSTLHNRQLQHWQG